MISHRSIEIRISKRIANDEVGGIKNRWPLSIVSLSETTFCRSRKGKEKRGRGWRGKKNADKGEQRGRERGMNRLKGGKKGERDSIGERGWNDYSPRSYRRYPRRAWLVNGEGMALLSNNGLLPFLPICHVYPRPSIPSSHLVLAPFTKTW